MSVVPMGKPMTAVPSSGLEIRTQPCKLVGHRLDPQADFSPRGSV